MHSSHCHHPNPNHSGKRVKLFENARIIQYFWIITTTKLSDISYLLLMTTAVAGYCHRAAVKLDVTCQHTGACRGYKACRLAPLFYPHKHILITKPELLNQLLILFTSTTTQKQHPRRLRRGTFQKRIYVVSPDTGFITSISLQFRNMAISRYTNHSQSNLPNLS